MCAKILPYDPDTLIKGNPLHSFLSGIIGAKMDFACPWLYNNYIQTVYSVDGGRFDFLVKWSIFYDAFDWKYVKRDFFELNRVPMWKFVKSALARDYYLCCFLEDTDKQLLVTGRRGGRLSAVRYDGNCSYSKSQLKADDLGGLGIASFNLIKVETGARIELYPDLIRQSLLDYLHPQNLSDRYSRFYILPKDNLYGVEACERISELLRGENDAEPGGNLCAVQILFDHKRLMLKRLEYLLTKGFLGDEKLLAAYSAVERGAASLLGGYREYALSGDRSRIGALCSLNADIIGEEKEVLGLAAGNIRVDK